MPSTRSCDQGLSSARSSHSSLAYATHNPTTSPKCTALTHVNAVLPALKNAPVSTSCAPCTSAYIRKRIRISTLPTAAALLPAKTANTTARMTDTPHRAIFATLPKLPLAPPAAAMRGIMQAGLTPTPNSERARPKSVEVLEGRPRSSEAGATRSLGWTRSWRKKRLQVGREGTLRQAQSLGIRVSWGNRAWGRRLASFQRQRGPSLEEGRRTASERRESGRCCRTQGAEERD